MSSERQFHIAKANAVIAAASGALIGSGIVFPPAALVGAAVGTVGFFRERSHQKHEKEFGNFLQNVRILGHTNVTVVRRRPRTGGRTDAQAETPLPNENPNRYPIGIDNPVRRKSSSSIEDPNYRAYSELRGEIDTRYVGKHLAFVRGKLAIVADTEESLFEQLDQLYPDDPAFIKTVAPKERVIDQGMPKNVKRQ